MILEGAFPGLDVEEAFARNTDGPDCPISRCYRDEDFTSLCQDAGFECGYVGGYLSRRELRSLEESWVAAIADGRLGDEHRDFLRATYLRRLRASHVPRPSRGHRRRLPPAQATVFRRRYRHRAGRDVTSETEHRTTQPPAGSSQGALDAENARFWDELCGSSLARQVGVADASAESLARFDAAYLEQYPYLISYLPEGALAGASVLEIGLGYGTLSGS